MCTTETECTGTKQTQRETELESLAFFRTIRSCKIRGQQIIYATLFYISFRSVKCLLGHSYNAAHFHLAIIHIYTVIKYYLE